ncbi:MAG TPA: NAD(P)-dependent oxidoreductase [Steroidobacteraceae bacterium]|nr:NAD(P)-dependent oxidoreductase [Steroidobacteraceae bacterium]
MSRILITGASGFIGCELAQLASRLAHQVTAVSAVNNDVERARCQRLLAAGIGVVVASLEDRAALAAALQGQDAVIHLAAAQHEAEAPESHFRRVNVEGTRTLLQLAVQAGVRRFVHGSTIGVYGAASAAVLEEDSPLAPANAYGRTKAEAELVARGFHAQIPVCIVRIAETYGPGDMRLLKLFRAIQRGRYLTIGDGRNLHQLIYVDDLARGLLAAAASAHAAGATCILAGTEVLTTDEMVAAIGAAVDRPRPPPHLPLWPFDLAALLFEKTMPPLGLRPLLHQRRLDFFRKSFRFSTAAAERLLGFRAEISFADGARRTAQWYRAQGMLPAAG